MPQFAYKALQRDGVLTEGFLDASNRHEAMRQVEGRGLKPIKLAESATATAKSSSPAHPSDKPSAGAGAGEPSVGFNLSLADFASTFLLRNSRTADVGRTCSDGICCSFVTSASARPTERKSSLMLFAMFSSGRTAIDRIGGGGAEVTGIDGLAAWPAK